jgi:L-lactate dehydrogenase complex protein LldF
MAMHLGSFVIQKPRLYAAMGRIGRRFQWMANILKLDPWTQTRDLPEPPKESFREWHSRTQGPLKKS